MSDIHEALRRWAKGVYPLEAGVELLVRTSNSRFAHPAQPWVQPGDDPGWWWIDVDQMNEDNYSGLSGGETRMLRIAASLLEGRPVDLSRNIPGLDREHFQFVLAAVARANGRHEDARWSASDLDGPDYHRGG